MIKSIHPVVQRLFFSGCILEATKYFAIFAVQISKLKKKTNEGFYMFQLLKMHCKISLAIDVFVQKI